MRADRATVLKGVGSACVGGALVAWGISGGSGPFVMGPGFVIVLGAFVGLYGLLTAVAALWTRARLRLSRREWQEWGGRLEGRRAEVLGRLRAGETARSVAQSLLVEDGVPEHVTLRYIIHVGTGGEPPSA